MAIANETSELQLENGNIYFLRGTSESLLPAVLDAKTVMLYTARRRGIILPTGAVGCICFDVKSFIRSVDGAKLAIM